MGRERGGTRTVRIVANELEVLGVDEGPRLVRTEQLDFPYARNEQSRRRVGQSIIDISRMHHELGDSRTEKRKNLRQRAEGEDARVNAADEMGRRDPVRCRDVPIAPGPRLHREVQERLLPCDGPGPHVVRTPGCPDP